MAVATIFDPADNNRLPCAASVVVKTAVGGAATEYIGPLYGKLEALVYTKVDFADTVDFTITNELTGETIWTQANRTASQVVRPRVMTQDTAGADSTTLVIREPYFFAGQYIKIAIAAGGDAKTGRFTALLS